MPSLRRIYWDSCVFLSYVNEDAERVSHISALLEDARNGEIEIVTSTVSVVEVAFGAAEQIQSSLSEEMEARINKLWEPASPLLMADFHILIAEAAKGMMRSGVPEGWSLKPMDAVHLATAQRLEVDEFHTYDGPLKKWASRVSYLISEPIHANPKLL